MAGNPGYTVEDNVHVAEKQHIAEVIERTATPPKQDPNFILHVILHVAGIDQWSWADITPNWTHHPSEQNPWNERAREVLP